MRVVIAVEDESYPQAKRAELGVALELLPVHALKVDQHGGIGQRVGISVSLIQRLELPVVLIDKAEGGHPR